MSTPRCQTNLAARSIGLVVTLGLTAWVFADALFASGMFVFRDAAHYYYPLFQLVAEQWADGRLPLWNPYENLGQPLLGDPTASVLYPGKLVFALPLSFAWGYRLYVVGHLLLAALGASRLARRFGGSRMAAGVAGLSYAFCGNVLYQYCNVIFLVGAAWLPLAMLCATRMLERDTNNARPTRWALLFGGVLAMMVLGGDPQMAYNAGLLAVFYAIGLWRQRRRVLPTEALPVKVFRWMTSWRSLRSPLALLALAAGTALLLSAVQIIPSAEFAARSGRDGGDFVSRLQCQLEPGTHANQTYQFSVGPWRLAEFVWPNISGRQFPTNRRWIRVIPAEGRVWVPSLYMGILPLLLGMGAMRWRRTSRRMSGTESPEAPYDQVRCRWLSWSVLLAIVASFGWYGPGWLVQEAHQAFGGSATDAPSVGSPFGGIYWLMTVVLPGYASFRYPAKLMVIAALGLSLLAARGWDETCGTSSSRSDAWLRRTLGWLGALSLIVAVGAVAIRPFWHKWLAGAKPDMLFGPLDTVGAANDLLAALLQTSLFCVAFWWLLGRSLRKTSCKTRQSESAQVESVQSGESALGEAGQGRAGGGLRWRPAWVAPLVLTLVAVDLGIANRWMVVCGPADAWTETPRLVEAIRTHEARNHRPLTDGEGLSGDNPARPLAREGQEVRASTDEMRRCFRTTTEAPPRVYRHRLWMPPAWRCDGAADRLDVTMQWDRDTLWPKYNLISRVPVIETHGAMMTADYQAMLRCGKRLLGGQSFPLTLATYVVLPGKKTLLHATPLVATPHGADMPRDVSLWENRHPLPRAWIVHQIDVLPPLKSNDLGDLKRRTERVLQHDGRPRDFRRTAVVETDMPLGDRTRRSGGAAMAPSGNASPRESCRVVHYDSQRVAIEAKLDAPGLVVLSDQFYPGWQLEVASDGDSPRTMPLVRTNRVMRGVWLPAGRHRLVYRYRPTALLCGAFVSGFGWIAFATLLFRWRRQRWRRQ